MGIEKNIRKSFWNVKKDMAEIKEEIKKLTEKYGKLESSLKSRQITIQEQPTQEYAGDLIQIREPKKKKKRK